MHRIQVFFLFHVLLQSIRCEFKRNCTYSYSGTVLLHLPRERSCFLTVREFMTRLHVTSRLKNELPIPAAPFFPVQRGLSASSKTNFIRRFIEFIQRANTMRKLRDRKDTLHCHIICVFLFHHLKKTEIYKITKRKIYNNQIALFPLNQCYRNLNLKQSKI